MPLSLETKIEELKKVGPAYRERLRKLQINTLRDLLFHFPYRYEDFSQLVSIAQLKENQTATVQARVKQINNRPIIGKRMVLTEALLEDRTGTIKAVWFNQPYLTKTIKPASQVLVSGKLSFIKKALCFSNPAYELLWPNKEPTHTGRLVPIYHETEGVSSRYLRFLIKPLLYLSQRLTDYLPKEIKRQFQLISLSQAIEQIHFPPSQELLQKARQRLAFDEIFLIQLILLKQKEQLKKEKAPRIPFDQKLIKSFVKKLPFSLTDDQRLAAWQIFQDLQKNQPMNRLLNGDVGSGKTIVAMMASLATAQKGYQVALMVPTEVLAKQHFKTFSQFLKNSQLNIALLIGSEASLAGPLARSKKTSRLQIKKAIAQGRVSIVIGTHALIQKTLIFKNLALAIVDEQHRFGVEQRAALQKSIYLLHDGLKTVPHLLSMTATPIPRTLALTVYGDLDISLLKTMPQGQRQVETKIISPQQRPRVYRFIKKELKQGGQAFVICPLIEESDKLGLSASVNQKYQKLLKVFPQFKIAMLHGRLKPKEKEEIMEGFRQGQIKILVATSVIEVGIDVPQATIMLIEGAERFGLAQLHQLRGRIGRGSARAYCFLLTESSSAKTNQRLKALLKSKDGFKLAEKDLKIRGPGDFLGTRQWGLPSLTIASLLDLELVQKARRAALTVLRKNLFTPLLRAKINQLEKKIHFE